MMLAAVIVAAGRGSRAGPGPPKPYRLLGGKSVLAHAILAMLAPARIEAVRTVIHPDHADHYRRAVAGLSDSRLLPPVHGGETRGASVLNGLRATRAERILVHDGARPCAGHAEVEALIDALDRSDAAFLALPVRDTLCYMRDGELAPGPDRKDLWRAQTPQGFNREGLIRAYGAAGLAETDDVTVARKAGIPVTAVAGSEANVKVTGPGDFAVAERLLRTPSATDVRTGNGFDVHRFTAGDHVMLCGIRIPHDRSLEGHSDADVALHAMTDSILGALGEGDIGTWFPPGEQAWKDAASDRFLEHAARVAAGRGFAIANLDCTILCESPRIGPHAREMRQRVAEIAGVAIERVSVKATTTEGLGFTGRREGIAAMASATLLRP